MRWGVVAIVLAGCGRLAFDPLNTTGDDASTTGDGRSGDAAGPPCVTETFSGSPGAQWDLWSGGTGFSSAFANNQLQLTLPANANGYTGGSLQPYRDITDGSISVEAVQIVNGLNTECFLEIAKDGSNNYDLQYSEGDLSFIRTINNVADQSTFMTYNPTTDRWWKMAHRSATNQILFFTSMDGVTWQQRFAADVAFPVSFVQLTAAGGASMGGNNNPGTPLFDNFTYCLP